MKAFTILVAMGMLAGARVWADGGAMEPAATSASVATSTATTASTSMAATAPAGWTITFDDEFNGDQLDLNKWVVEDQAGKYNNELEYYSPANVTVSGGLLHLKSEKRDFKGRHYVSGALNTKGKFSQEYGRFEMRAKLPTSQGIWPAFWLLPESGAWPPEIDIMELIGKDSNTVHMTSHWGTVAAHQSKGGPYTGPDFSADFHTYAVDWEPGKIRWFVDGVERFSNGDGVPSGPFYVILNTAVGGDWPGKPNGKTVFPQSYDVDWVRVMAKE